MKIEELIRYPDNTLVDVRTTEEYKAGHVQGSINIPLDQVANRVDEFREMKKPLVVFCLSGGRSGRAVEYLKAQGIGDIHNGGGWAGVKEIRKGV